MKRVMFASIKCFLLLGACAPIDVPGETKNPPYIADFAASQIFSTLRADVPGCSDYKVINTIFDGYPYADNQNSWYETWIVDMCGKRFSVKAHFYTVDGKPEHTTVSIAGRNIKPLQ